MYRKMKKKTNMRIVLTIVLMLVIEVCVAWFNDETRDYLLTGDNINRISANEVYRDKIVRGQLYAILGCYAEDEGGAYYIIPVGEDEYMGVYLPKKYEDRAWQIIEDTVAYINGEQDSVSSRRIPTGGIIYAMEGVEQQYFREWFTDTGYMDAGDIDRYTIDYTYEVIPFHEWNEGGDIVCYIIIGICLVTVLICLFWLVTGRAISEVKKTIRQNGWNQEEIEADLLSGLDKNNIIAGRKYLLQNSGWKWHLYTMRDIIWAYQFTHTTEHRLYGVIKTGTTVVYSVQFYLRNGKMKAISVKNEKEAQDILEFLARTQPHIIVGYSDELKAVCQQNFGRLVQFSDEKGMQQYGQGYYEGTTQESDSWQNDEPTLKYDRNSLS